MNTADPLLGPRVKIDRAKKHFADLEAAIFAFKTREPWSVVVEVNASSGYEIHRFREREEIPAEWGAITGDCIHNLRSALDILANELVLANGGTPNNYTAFPIGSDIANFESSALNRIKDASAQAIKIVRRIKPYNGGCDTLYRLHSLDIADKHRLLIPVAAANQKFGVRSDIRLAGTEHFPPPAMLVGPPINKKFPLKDGDELFAYRRAPKGPENKTEFQLEFEVAFSNGKVPSGEPVLASLQELIDLTERIVQIFARHIFGHR